MRIWDRLKLLVPLLMAMLTAAETSAQQMAPFPSAGTPAFMAGQGYSATSYQGMPQSFQSHPGISPYDNAFEQHFTSDGLWFRRFLGGMGPRNEYFFNVDFVNSKARSQKGLIGDPNAPSFLQQGADDIGLGFFDVDLPDDAFLEPFPVRNALEAQSVDTRGVRLRGGVENQQGWGFNWWAAYNGDSSNRRALDDERLRSQLHFADALFLEETGGIVNRGLPNNLRLLDEREILENRILGRRLFDAADAEEFGISGETSDILDRHLYPYASVPIQTGTATDPYGFPMIFDVYFDIETSIETYGSGAHFSFNPIIESDTVKVRPIVGGRYFRIDESFGWRGGNSGLDYTFNSPDGIDDDDDFWIDNVDENGSATFTGLFDDGITEILVRSFIRSNVRSQLAGPEIGIEYLIGEKKGIEVTGHTKFGLMLNTERAFLEGDNIGHQYNTDIDLVNLTTIRAEMFDTSTVDVGRTQNYFTDTNDTSHLSPLFEQQLNCEIPIFSHVPVLKDMWQLEHAKIRLGWNFLFMGEVADPSQSIIYHANPRAGLFPTLRIHRSNFYQNTLSAGINWEI